MSHSAIALRIWFLTWLTLSIGIGGFAIVTQGFQAVYAFPISCFGTSVISFPAFLILVFTVGFVKRSKLSFNNKLAGFALLLFTVSLLYGLTVGCFLFSMYSFTYSMAIIGGVTGILFTCTCIASLISYKQLRIYLSGDSSFITTEDKGLLQSTYTIKSTQMEHNDLAEPLPETSTSQSNKILIKGVITGVLILVMLIPTIFISNLVAEREQRQKEVVAEVSSKWATSQTVTSPYLVIPYNEAALDEKKKPVVIKKQVIILPENLQVKGNVMPEKRLRSIYTVLLYRSNLNAEGLFKPVLPSDINADNLLFNEAKLCMGISDFKGIEEKITINLNGKWYDLNPGLPTNDIDSAGLSCSIPLTKDDLSKEVRFTFNLKIKGSEQLHFVPLAGNSSFALQSSWANPSFDGNTLPTERVVNDKGFNAMWNFNKANLPFNTVLKDFELNRASYAFGVSMLQPADQYAKTSRSVKYAILFIGLTFSLFFIIELLQRKPVHPVQYILVGIALIIFYSLLLSFSEFILFNNAYLIAATATVLLVSLYAKGHFASWKIAGLFALVLASLYGFIFILIQLEDTALLVGSIGLFGVIALVMYASRKINWYHPTLKVSAEGA